MKKNSNLYHGGMIIIGMLVMISCVLLCFYKGGMILSDKEDSSKAVRMAAYNKANGIEGNIVDVNDLLIMTPDAPVSVKNTAVPFEYAHLLGYNSIARGQSGLRAVYHDQLYDYTEKGEPVRPGEDPSKKPELKGATLKLTINDKIQKLAYRQLKINSGAPNENKVASAVVLDVKTGDVIAMTSINNIDYDVSKIDDEAYYNKYSQIKEFFFNLPTGIPEAPGSVFKIVTAAIAIDNELENTEYDDRKSGLDHIESEEIAGGNYMVSPESKPITNHGQENGRVFAYADEEGNVKGIDMQLALNRSLNTYFAYLGREKIGQSMLSDYMNKFKVDTEMAKENVYRYNLDLGFVKLPSYVGFDTGYMSEEDAKGFNPEFNLANTFYGQGRLALTPLHIAMMGQALCNDGKMLTPRLVKSVTRADGTVISDKNKVMLDEAQVVSPETSKKLKEYLYKVTTDDVYGAFSALKGIKDKSGNTIRVYSKTGTAEVPGGGDKIYHAYLITMTDDYVVLISTNRTTASGGSHAKINAEILKALYSL